MDLNFTTDELAFRQEVRQWVADNLPKDISHKVHHALRLSRDDMQRWAKILGKKGWLASGWPKQFGGPGWTAVQKHLFEEECARAGSPRIVPFGPVMVAPVIMAFGSRRAAEALPARHRLGRGLVEPGLQRARRGLRPGIVEDTRRAPRRQVHRQWPEDLDHARPVRRMDLLPGAHQQRRQAANRHQLPADRHEVARRHGAPDRHARRRARGERGVLRQRRGARGEPDRRREQGLDLRQAPARPRTHQHRRRQSRQARDRTPEAHRQGRRRLRRQALSRPDRAARGRHRRARDAGAAGAVGREERQAKPRHRGPAEDQGQRDPAALQRVDDARRRPVHDAVRARGDGSRLAGRLVRPLRHLRAAGRQLLQLPQDHDLRRLQRGATKHRGPDGPG